MTGAMTGRICLVTGATSGIGEATAAALANLGATVLVHGRDPEACTRVVRRLQDQTNNPAHHAFVADLASLAAVRDLAAQVRAHTNQLHVLLNNAGAMYPTRLVSADGHEKTFAVNHLAPFLLTNLLLDLLRSSAPSRIITVSSNAHRHTAFDILNLQMREGYEGRAAYNHSKLMNILFTRELARRLAGSGVTANALSPGLVHTAFGVKDGFGADQQEIMNRGATPEVGAQTSVHLAASPEVATATGGYYIKSELVEPAEAAQDPESATALWELSARLVGLHP